MSQQQKNIDFKFPMDIDIERRVNEAIEQLRKLSIDGIDFNQMDPIAKMMLIALINEVQKIQDYVDSTSQRIVERYCSDFIPYENVNAVPAIETINVGKDEKYIVIHKNAYKLYPNIFIIEIRQISINNSIMGI